MINRKTSEDSQYQEPTGTSISTVPQDPNPYLNTHDGESRKCLYKKIHKDIESSTQDRYIISRHDDIGITFIELLFYKSSTKVYIPQ